MLAGSKRETPATSDQSFEIKSASLAFLVLALKTTDVTALRRDLVQSVATTPGVFDHEPVVLDFSAVPNWPAGIPFGEILNLLRGFKMLPVAVQGLDDQQAQSALEYGLPQAAEAVRREPAILAAMPVPVVAAPLGAMVIDKPLRSGQQVYAKGCDLVVLAAVNPGAEVIADGHIHVYAPLRGKAIAGARGHVGARIFALCMEPELVSIAGIYRTTETPLPAEVLGRVAQIRLDGERLVYEALGTKA